MRHLVVAAALLLIAAPSASTQQRPAVCAIGDGTNEVMATLAMTIAREIGRWNVVTDLDPNGAKWSMMLTATGKARCADGKCALTQAVLDLQNAPPGVQLTGDVTLNPNAIKSTLVSRYNEQRNCLLRGGTGSANCTSEQHKLTFMSSATGACMTQSIFSATSTAGGALRVPTQFRNNLLFAGYPSNPNFTFASTSTTVTVQTPKLLVQDNSTLSSGTLDVCLMIATRELAGRPCRCGTSTGTLTRAAWNANTYRCVAGTTDAPVSDATRHTIRAHLVARR